MERYNPIKIENKWRRKWQGKNNYAADNKSRKPKQYILDMYPYPSGAGLHVGHLKGYIGTDVYSRYKRMRGFNVLHPMGWDSFGLPAENYAVKTGVHPQKTTEDAIKNYKKQIERVSLSYDWSREISSHTPEYYKWTQWFFILLYKNNFAYKAKAKVNWDPVDKTVLANEQILPDGTAERSGAKVVQKELEQWFFKITDFAQELIDDLDKVDWPSHTVTNQRNWIGRSEGVAIKFDVKRQRSNAKGQAPKGKCSSIEVFTTRADTLFGATYMVLSPEHELVEELKSEITNWEEVKKYVNDSKDKTEIERTAENKEKTGVELIGIKAINPANNEEIPVWVADYVLTHYGTGAIMAVPAHDERDMEFAKKYNLAVSDAALVPADEVISKVGAKKVVSYRLRDWLISRQRYWGAPIPIVYDPDGRAHPVPEEHLPWLLPDDVEFTPKGYSPLEQSEKLKERTEKLFGKGWTPEVDTMDTFVCSSWYFFRFTDPKNKKEFASRDKIEQWIPVDLYVGGAEHTVLHLMYARFFTKVLHRLGYINFDEPFLKLRHQGLIGGANGRKMSKRYGNVVDPQDIVGNFGADTLRVYEMFIGPFEKGAFWQVDGIRGAHRFLGRVWGLVQNHESRIKNHESQNSKSETLYPQPYTPDPNLRHKTIRKVTEDIETLNFNTAISALMEYLNALYENGYGEEDIKILLLLLAPFAPHITEELWSRLAGAENEGGEKLGEKGSIHNQNWPEFNAQLAKQEMITIPVQINGKLRAQIEVETDTDEEKLQKLALENEKIKLYLGSKKPKKMVVVKNKIVNIVL